jgi:hypothetical protein
MSRHDGYTSDAHLQSARRVDRESAVIEINLSICELNDGVLGNVGGGAGGFNPCLSTFLRLNVTIGI